MKPVLRWWQYFALHSFVGKSKSILFCRAIQLRDTLSLIPWIVQILRRYGHPFEFSEFPWHILRNIFLPQDRKKIKIKMTAKSLSAFYLYGNPGNSGQKERFISVEISRKKSKTFRSITFSPFLPKRTNGFLYYLSALPAPGFISRGNEKSTGILLMVQLNHVPVFGAKKTPVAFDGNFSPKFPYKW